MKRDISTATTKRRRNSRRRQLQSEQLETRALLSGWTIGIDAGAGDVSPSLRQTVDPAGNLYTAGAFEGIADFDGSAATRLLNSGVGRDAFVARYSAVDGSLAWARQFGGVESVVARAVSYDPSGAGSIVAVGVFRGSADFTGDGIADATSNGIDDGFVVKLDTATGVTLWFRTFGGKGVEEYRDVAAFGGQIFMTGHFSNTADLNPGSGLFTLTAAGKGANRPYDAFVQNLDANGNFVTAWQIGGTDSDHGNGIHVDANGVYVLGQFSGTADFQPGSGVLNRTSLGGFDAFLVKYTATGSHVWLDVFGSAAASEGIDWSLAASTTGLYVTGNVSSAIDLNPGSGTYLVSSGDNTDDALVAAYTKTDGSFRWGRAFGTLATYESAGTRAAVEPVSGNVYVGSTMHGTIDFTPGVPGDDLTSAGGRDSLLVKFDSLGGYLDAWRSGGPGWDSAARVAGVVGNTVYVVGRNEPGTVDFPTGDTLTVTDGWDMSVMAFDETAVPPSPLLAASVPVKSAEQSLSISEYQPIVAEALARWETAGVNTAALSGLNVQVRNLGGTTLGQASANTIWLDDNAAGWGWFVDSTPGNNSEFLRFGNQGEQHRMDLLTVVMHEMGHLLGHDHNVEGVMAETLVAGVRRTDTEHDHLALVDQVFGQAVDHHADSVLGTLLDDRLDSRRPWFKRRR